MFKKYWKVETFGDKKAAEAFRQMTDDGDHDVSHVEQKYTRKSRGIWHRYSVRYHSKEDKAKAEKIKADYDEMNQKVEQFKLRNAGKDKGSRLDMT